jgi:hypothetical protein
MSFSSRAKKVKPKGIVRDLKLVQTINRRGANTIKTEEIITPKHGSNDFASTSQRNYSSSPNKRRRIDNFDGESLPFDLDVDDSSKRRQTLVFPFPSIINNF